MIPEPVRAWVRPVWLKVLAGAMARRTRRCAFSGGDRPAVCYGVERIPGPDEPLPGGLVKFQHLQRDFPHSPQRFNLLYLVSSGMPFLAEAMARAAQDGGARFLWNQDGVGFPAWAGPGYEKINAPMADLLHRADYVFYQSRFCQESADRFLGKREGRFEILYNAVDTRVFRPASERRRDPGRPVLLAAGSHWQAYRVEHAVRALAEVSSRLPEARLVLAGRFCWEEPDTAARQVEEWVRRYGVAGRVDVRGAYTQREAVGLLQQADLLVHLKCNDPCPTLVLEAMACGLPVVHSASGGVPELVGPSAGIGVTSDVTWEKHVPPDPAAVADAVARMAEDVEPYAAAARERALKHFDLEPWRQRHREVMMGLVTHGQVRQPEGQSTA